MTDEEKFQKDAGSAWEKYCEGLPENRIPNPYAFTAGYKIGRRASAAENQKLQAFKDYVHKRLDDAGVEVDPESEHKEHGCRIGGRLDIVLRERAELDKVKKENETAKKFIDAMGLTKREYFAAKAIQGILASFPNGMDTKSTHQDIACEAVNLADALLAELSKED